MSRIDNTENEYSHSVQGLNGTDMTAQLDNATSFFMNNGTRVFIKLNSTEKMVYIIIDVNGVKQPNMLGKDIFWYVLATDRVGPFGQSQDAAAISKKCRNRDGRHCAAKIIHDCWKISNDYPW